MILIESLIVCEQNKLTSIVFCLFEKCELFEFQARAVEAGTIQVNEKPTCVDHIIKNGDFILNKVHRYDLTMFQCNKMIYSFGLLFNKNIRQSCEFYSSQDMTRIDKCLKLYILLTCVDMSLLLGQYSYSWLILDLCLLLVQICILNKFCKNQNQSQD